MTARVFLGFCEGPMAPAMVVYLSNFYTRKELSLRYPSHDGCFDVDHSDIDYLESL